MFEPVSVGPEFALEKNLSPLGREKGKNVEREKNKRTNARMKC